MIRQSKQNQGFTLRDLIVTMILLAVVIAFLLPMLRDIQRRNEATACLVNLRASGLATLAFSQDNDGRFPPFGFDLSTDDHGQLSVQVVLRSEQESGLDQYQAENLTCPSDRAQGYLQVGEDLKSTAQVTIGYGYNINLIQVPHRIGDLGSPSTTTVLYDGSMSGASGPGKDVSGLYQDTFAFIQHASVHRHSSRINLVYADWHTVTLDVLERSSIEILNENEDAPD